MQSINQKIPLNIIITSILLALFADTKILNLIVLAAHPSLAGTFMTAMYATVITGLFYMGIIHQHRSLLKLSSSHIRICILCITWYLFTIIFIGEPSVSLSFFCIFTIVAFLIPGIIRIDVRIFIMALLILPSVGIFYIDQIFLTEILETGIVSMGTCYALLVPVLANLIFLRFFFAKECKIVKILMLIFTGINIFYLVQMAMFGSRGPVLCVLLMLVCFFNVKVNNMNRITIHRGHVVTSIIAVATIALLFIPILKSISNYLESYDISLNVIDKFLDMGARGDMSNGRKDIDVFAWKGIWQSPILGHGIAQFERNTGIIYPHHFIIQMIYDGGFILTILVLTPIILSAINKIKKANHDEIICLIFLFFCSVPGALFSGDLWNSNVLWIFFGFVLSKHSIYKMKQYCCYDY